MLYRAAPRRKGSLHKRLKADTLRKVSVAMLPFYKAIASRRTFAIHWSEAVIQGNLE